MNFQSLLSLASLSSLFRRAPVSQLQGDEEGHGPRLKRVLRARHLFFAGLGAIVGVGIFVMPGVVANRYAGPAVILSYVIAAVVSGLVALSYAELASMIPVSGSAYTYARASLGELPGWIIGWDLILEYIVGAAAVASGFSSYFQSLLKCFGIILPESLSHAPGAIPWPAVIACTVSTTLGSIGLVGVVRSMKQSLPWKKSAPLAVAFVLSGVSLGLAIWQARIVMTHLKSVNVCASLIVFCLTLLVIAGVKHMANANIAWVLVKMAVLLFVVGTGAFHVLPSNWHPFMPFGIIGVVGGAGLVFFCYIGFDMLSTTGEECVNPQRDLPIGILASLAVSTVLYIAVSLITTGVLSYTLLGGNGTEAASPIIQVIEHMGWNIAVPLVAVGALSGILSVLSWLLYAASRIIARMSADGLLTPAFTRVHPKLRTPVRSIILCALPVAVMAGILPIGDLAELCNIGTLAAFIVVSIGVLVLRRIEPTRERKFRCPGFPYVPVLGAVLSFTLMVGLPLLTWIRFGAWLVIGLIVYFAYGYKHSRFRSVDS